jgi:hypothetical protein
MTNIISRPYSTDKAIHINEMRADFFSWLSRLTEQKLLDAVAIGVISLFLLLRYKIN